MIALFICASKVFVLLLFILNLLIVGGFVYYDISRLFGVRSTFPTKKIQKKS